MFMREKHEIKAWTETWTEIPTSRPGVWDHLNHQLQRSLTRSSAAETGRLQVERHNHQETGYL